MRDSSDRFIPRETHRVVLRRDDFRREKREEICKGVCAASEDIVDDNVEDDYDG